ncbi:MAG: FGGY-family carbohydrate kinase [Succinivibrio sp.]|nr:FGGY-family carbohydrate kinase [Succinivibrio sp.]
MSDLKNIISEGKAILGIEFGSTRIKAVLINPEDFKPVAQGAHEWENRLENGFWTYHLDDIWTGLQDCYQDLLKDVKNQYGVAITKLASIGFSAMMHGYMAFDKDGNQLAQFRTWRNANTTEAAAKLTDLFQFNIPERWSISHLYQCILNKEDHISKVDFFTTLAGYVHWKLTGEKVLGVGDAAGMFPIDSDKMDYNQEYLAKFNNLLKEEKLPYTLEQLLPKVLTAGENAGTLTAEGAKLLDTSGTLQPGCLLCPPEGDAGTGMVATNSVAVRTGNVSAGTSIFAMVVLEKALQKLHREIDCVTTPDGLQDAMVHANNCTSDLNAWVGLFADFLRAANIEMDTTTLFKTLYNEALNNGAPDCDGIITYGYLSGENITNMPEGRPLLARMPNSKFNVANLFRSNLNTSLGAIRIGMNILKSENVKIDKLLGHGGLFKTKGVGQSIMADALNTPVWVMTTAGEGGAWGIALLAAYATAENNKQTLPQFLDSRVFKDADGSKIDPTPAGVAGFDKFLERYVLCLGVERQAVECLKA